MSRRAVPSSSGPTRRFPEDARSVSGRFGVIVVVAFLVARDTLGDSFVQAVVAHPRPRRPHRLSPTWSPAAPVRVVSPPAAIRAPVGPGASLVRPALARRAAESRDAALGSAPPERRALKDELLDLVTRSKRGSDASLNGEISRVFKLLEGHNPCAAPLERDAVKGEWELLWTTSESILGLGRPFPFRPLADKPILQYLDPAKGRARNLEYTLLGTNSVEAEIKPIGEDGLKDYVSKLDDFLMFKLGAQEPRGGTYLPEGSGLEKTAVAVRFKTFKVLNGLISIPAPESATGILQVTYLDDDLRLSRGDRGNLFVLRKAGDEQVPS